MNEAMLTEAERKTIFNTRRFVDTREALPPVGVVKLLEIIDRLSTELEKAK